jgi:hypothetical protein
MWMSSPVRLPIPYYPKSPITTEKTSLNSSPVKVKSGIEMSRNAETKFLHFLNREENPLSSRVAAVNLIKAFPSEMKIDALSLTSIYDGDLTLFISKPSTGKFYQLPSMGLHLSDLFEFTPKAINDWEEAKKEGMILDWGDVLFQRGVKPEHYEKLASSPGEPHLSLSTLLAVDIIRTINLFERHVDSFSSSAHDHSFIA